MKSIIVFVCILYSCHAGVVNGGKDALIDGKDEKLPAVTEITTESVKTGSTIKVIPIGPTDTNTTTSEAPTTSTAKTTTAKTPTTTKIPPTTSITSTTTTTTTKSPPTTPSTTPIPTTTPTSKTSSSATTKAPIPSSTAVPVSSTTVTPPSNRGFDGPSFIGGIVLASGLMAIGFVALKFYKARTELNYHTL